MKNSDAVQSTSVSAKYIQNFIKRGIPSYYNGP